METGGIPKFTEDIFNLSADRDKEARQTADQINDMVRAGQKVFLGSAEGLSLFWFLMEQTYMFQPYDQQNAGSYVKEGRREMGMMLLALIGFTPDSNSLRKLALGLAAHSNSKGE